MPSAEFTTPDKKTSSLQPNAPQRPTIYTNITINSVVKELKF